MSEDVTDDDTLYEYCLYCGEELIAGYEEDICVCCLMEERAEINDVADCSPRVSENEQYARDGSWLPGSHECDIEMADDDWDGELDEDFKCGEFSLDDELNRLLDQAAEADREVHDG